MAAVSRRQSSNAHAVDKAENGIAPSSSSAAVVSSSSNGRTNRKLVPHTTPSWVYGLFALFIVVTIVAFPRPFQPHGQPSLKHVFYYGWLTAISTGLGAVPFLFLPNIASYWVGVSNGESQE